jgi:ATP-binding cassette, subfamily B, bacterial
MPITLKRYLSLLTTYLQPQWRSVLLLTCTLLAAIGLQLINPQILRYFIDTASIGGATSSLVQAGFLFIGIVLPQQFVSIASTYLTTNVAWTATNQLRSDLVAHCLSLDMSYHKMRTTGEMIERIDGDVNTLTNFFSQFVINLCTSLLLLLAILILLCLIDWRIGSVMTIFSLIALLILMRLRKRTIPLSRSVRQTTTTFYSFLSERLIGTEDIRANGATAYVLQRFYLLMQAWAQAFRAARTASATISIISLLLFVIGTALALSIGTYIWMQGTITIGTVYLIFAYTDQLAQPIQQIQQQLQDLQMAEACISRIEELRETRSTLHDGIHTMQDKGALALAFNNVTFGYVANEPILQQLHFTLKPGRVLGILGRTGSGKTTLARLLFRLYDPQSGDIHLNGLPIQTLQLRSLRQSIGMVTQDVQLFHATVRANLTLFNPAIADEQIHQALENVGLQSWYQTLPAGLETLLGGNSEGVSAGEAQLLAFARVFLTQPGLVILDEASSRLDPATEHNIEQAIDKLFEQRTAIVIAHRLSTIQRVDDILILEDGHMQEYGPRILLQSDPTSHFSQLLRTGAEVMVTKNSASAINFAKN